MKGIEDKKYSKTKNLFQKLFNQDIFIGWLVFTIIFTVYFCSSVGLINSLDTPQYFTTEAVLKYRSLNLSFFANDPHYFVYPDVFFYKNQTLSFRGYLTSVIMIPIHLFSNFAQHFFQVRNFPKEIITKNFRYELSIVSFYTLFSAGGIFFIYLLAKEVLKKNNYAIILTFLFALGTYIWKYSGLYTRHGITIFLLGTSIYSLWKYINSKNSFFFFIILLIWSICFGIDIFLFFSLSLFNFFLIFYTIKKLPVKKFFVFPLIILIINIIFNYSFYGNISFNQNNKWFYMKDVLKEKIDQALFSGPIFLLLCLIGKIFH